jgi:hypothetical protein
MTLPSRIKRQAWRAAAAASCSFSEPASAASFRTLSAMSIAAT